MFACFSPLGFDSGMWFFIDVLISDNSFSFYFNRIAICIFSPKLMFGAYANHDFDG